MNFESFFPSKLDTPSRLEDIASKNHEKILDIKELDKPIAIIFEDNYEIQDSKLALDARQDLPESPEETELPSWHRAEGSDRPTPRESEVRAQEVYGGEEQKSYKNGEEVAYGTPGSTRPDLVVKDENTGNITAIEVKNYDCTRPERVDALCKEISRQVGERCEHMPEGTKQVVVLDLRGQDLTQEQIDEIKQKIKDACAGSYDDIPVEELV